MSVPSEAEPGNNAILEVLNSLSERAPTIWLYEQRAAGTEGNWESIISPTGAGQGEIRNMKMAKLVPVETLEKLLSMARKTVAPTPPAGDVQGLVTRLRINATSWRRDDALVARDESEGELADEAATALQTHATALASANAEIERLTKERDEANETLALVILALPSGYGEGERGQGPVNGVRGLRNRADTAEAHLKVAVEALTKICNADAEFRRSMPDSVEKDPVTLACDEARSALTTIGGGDAE